MNPDDIIQVRLKHKDTGEEVEKSIRRADLEARLTAGKAKGWSVVSQTDTSVPAKSPAEQAKRDTAAKEAALLEQRNAVKKDVGSASRSFVSGVFDGLSSNFLDEVAGVASPALKERMRRNVDVQKSESPNAYAAGQMAGSVGQQLGLTRLIPGMKTPAGQMAYSGIEGAISGIGQEEAVTPESALYAGAAGAGGGVLGQVGGTALGRAGSGALKKLVGNTNLEGALQIDERLAKEALGKQLAEFNASKATGIILREKAAKEAAELAAMQKKIPGFAGMPTTAAEAAAAFEKQFLENKANIKAAAENFQTNYPDPFSVTGAIGSSLGSEATDLQSYQNKLTEKLGMGNDAIDAVNKAAAGAIDVTLPNIPVQLTPAEEQKLVTQAAIDRIIELNKADAANKRKWHPSYEQMIDLSP
jgi:hypothetical protein